MKMRSYNQFEFKCSKLDNFRHKIRKESGVLIDEIIKKHSPIQKGEDVAKVVGYDLPNVMVRVSEVMLMAISSWGYPGERMSFSYRGLLLSKKGLPMKNRKPIWFDTFMKDGKKIHMPSYNRVEIKKARMHHR